MGKGANLVPDEAEKSVSQESKIYKWSEIRQNKWIVIDNYVYDVTNFSNKHPGGKVILLNNVGQDATVNLEKKKF